jgi:hypothetical protein
VPPLLSILFGAVSRKAQEIGMLPMFLPLSRTDDLRIVPYFCTLFVLFFKVNHEHRIRSVSANHQNLDRQIALLKRAGCKKIFRVKQSGREGIKRPQLDKAINTLSRGDVLIVAEWDRTTRSTARRHPDN